jgi:hypothetical protein
VACNECRTAHSRQRYRAIEEERLKQSRCQLAQIIKFPPSDDQSFEGVLSICKERALTISEHLEAYERGCDKVAFTEKIYASSGKLHALIQDMTLNAEIWKLHDEVDNDN